MIDLNIEIEELISNNATDFQISKVFKSYYKVKWRVWAFIILTRSYFA